MGKAKGEKRGEEAVDSSSPATPSYDLAKRGDLFRLVRDEDNDSIRSHVGLHLAQLVAAHALTNYTVLILFDEHDPISSYHSNKIYEAASSAAGAKDILLIIHSGGGGIEPAYLISKTCKRLAQDKFVVVVPRRAKSAATLVSLGAAEIHMGLMSELGPIDPQIGGYPTLALANALNVLADLSCRFPGSGSMFSQYLTNNLELKDLGYFERIGESAAQYAERLLNDKEMPAPHNAATLANHFVNHYKEHGFVIDIDEAHELLGDTVRADTPEYRLGNEVFQILDFLGLILQIVKDSRFDYVGAIDTGLTIRKVPTS